mmetsp:Transcript_131105/g.184874  ORF Transcript_131105/g.184874 Transcript_131105/m.184874 type:complete len:146 (+) Transcript_131105:79-516(+)
MANEGYDKGNIFAKILAGEIPCHKVFETEHALAILDAFPTREGHCLLIPKGETMDVRDMSEDHAAKALSALPRLSKAVTKATGCTGVNVIANAGGDAGQMVFHTHFHVIPRFADDKEFLPFPPSAKEMISAEKAAEILAKLTPHI